ncbi:MAG: copper resistance CopC family protein [Janthinobacterium lividum]
MTHRRRALVEHASRPLLPLALLVALLLGGTFVVLGAAPAHAVTPVASEPRARQKVSQAPGAVTLAFSREVDPSVAKVVVLGPDGKNVTSGPLIVEGTNVTSQLREDLDRGTYTVHYRVDGRNGDPEGGAYQFAYGSGSFTDLPDRSWSGEDEEPAVLAGTNPNGSEAPDPPSTATNTPGIEVTSQAASSAPPPPTDPPRTVKAPPGPRTDEASSEEPSASATPQADAGGSGGAPWIVGGVVLLLAVAGTVYGLWRKNQEKSTPGHD